MVGCNHGYKFRWRCVVWIESTICNFAWEGNGDGVVWSCKGLEYLYQESTVLGMYPSGRIGLWILPPLEWRIRYTGRKCLTYKDVDGAEHAYHDSRLTML